VNYQVETMGIAAGFYTALERWLEEVWLALNWRIRA